VFLSPDAYAEVNLSTSGHFGGLGIVISVRDQMPTIMRPTPGGSCHFCSRPSCSDLPAYSRTSGCAGS
jgi:hypothetical protein